MRHLALAVTWMAAASILDGVSVIVIIINLYDGNSSWGEWHEIAVRMPTSRFPPRCPVKDVLVLVLDR